ncbi:MAG: transmembrane 220 family protein [Myxococcota bacterium]
MRTACLMATALFALFSYWQFNDLEQYGTQLWLGWALLYAFVSAVSLFSAWQRLPRLLYWGAALLAGLAAALRSLEIEWSAGILNNPGNPAGNETGGLLVVALWLVFLGWNAGR